MKDDLYRAFGLTISSEISLPELIPAETSGHVDVWIRRSQVLLSDRNRLKKGREVNITSDGIVISWNEVGSFLICNGKEICFDNRPGVSEDIIRLPLLGIVLGTLLHQREFLTLHASTVAISGKAIGFIGQKGMGKSTMAASLLSRGHRLITDDVLALKSDRETPDSVMAIPAYPHLKLWPSSSEAIGSDPKLLQEIHPQLDKQALRPVDQFQETPLRLDTIYLLCKGDQITRTILSQKEALIELLSHSYAARFLGEGGAGADSVHFNQCAALAKRVPIFRLERPADLTRLEEVAQFVEGHTSPSAFLR